MRLRLYSTYETSGSLQVGAQIMIDGHEEGTKFLPIKTVPHKYLCRFHTGSRQFIVAHLQLHGQHQHQHLQLHP